MFKILAETTPEAGVTFMKAKEYFGDKTENAWYAEYVQDVNITFN